ncbi:cation:proton antiporter [Motilimonas cestriensis]|uniref:Cation:proton antiporter n=1 Tax=Motilimonas cestriensis TaxID=2742685 RepID=A0ABS8W902_9GAMM|nr:cation:proton antiporter [Motilimonas cestriensis]MCE2594582.1 cation:proton antiporter [Motilimonas cestriensis]
MLEFVLLLLLAVINVAIFRRLALPAILAYLFTGLLIGPSGLSFFADFHGMDLIAELGIAFLMFSLGLEFSLPKLITMRGLVFGLGGAQVFLSSILFFIVALLAGTSWQQGVVIAGALSMSSTAIIIKQLVEQQKIHTRRGQLAVSVLLFQDLAVMPLLIVVPILAVPVMSSGDIALSLIIAMAKGLVAVLSILAIGKWCLPRLFQEIASDQSDELFVLMTLLVALLAGGLTHMLGLSMALGAFLAGMMLSESHYKHQLEADIRPFRDVLMGLFFVTIGMLIDLAVLAEFWLELIGIVAVLMLTKMLIVALLAKLLQQRNTDAIAAGMMLCQVGEFGFVLVALANKYELLSATQSSIIVAVGVISMALTPPLVKYSHKLSVDLLHSSEALLKKRKPLPGEFTDHVIICGYGRVGQTIARFLKTENISYVALDRDPMRIKESVSGGESVAFGDACRREILLMLGVCKAKLVIITFHNHKKTLSMLNTISLLNPDAKVLVRTKDDKDIVELKANGAAEVVPEVLEGSLMLVSHVLLMSGVPISKIIKKMQQERENQYQHLHSFFHGETSENKAEHQSERLHAVEMLAGSLAIGRALVQFELANVVIMEWRRDGKNILDTADPFELIEQGDILLLSGESKDIEIAENHLLYGR